MQPGLQLVRPATPWPTVFLTLLQSSAIVWLGTLKLMGDVSIVQLPLNFVFPAMQLPVLHVSLDTHSHMVVLSVWTVL